MFYRRKPVVIEATQWFKNGDHPLDYASDRTEFDGETPKTVPAEHAKAQDWEGAVVRRYRRPDDTGERPCEKCGNRMHDHGWIDTPGGGHVVCPGDWIITDSMGEHYPCKPGAFAWDYEAL